MKRNWPYILVLLLVVFMLFRMSRSSSRRQVIWSENYTWQSKNALGCYVTNDFIDAMMDGQTEIVDKTAYQLLADSQYVNSNYVFVNSDFNPSAQDVMQLCRFVSRGNNVMISARDFGFLKDTLKVIVTDPLYFDMYGDSTYTMGQLVDKGSRYLEANLVNPHLRLEKNARFDHTTFATVFASVDTAHTTLLGTDADSNANFIRVKMGNGSFYLHTLPDAFGNYYATDSATAQYMFRALSYLPKQHTFLDAHYKVGRVMNDDPRRYLLSDPALKLAYLVLIITGFLVLLFGGKRRQRPVPVLALPTNTTLEFVEQVGALYYRQGNHADIAHKKIAYFLESVRSRFYVPTQVFDERFLNRIESVSGLPQQEVRHLFSTIDYLRTTTGCSDKDLKNLEQLIRTFNQRSKR